MSDIDRRRYTFYPSDGLYGPSPEQNVHGEMVSAYAGEYYHESAMREVVALLKELELDPLGVKKGLCDRVDEAFAHYKDLLNG